MGKFNESIKGKLYHYFDQRFHLKNSTKGWMRCDCVWCGGHHTMGVNVQVSKIHCFKCLEAKKPIEVLMEIERFETLSQAYKFLAIQQEYEYFERTSRQKVEAIPIELPESFTLINQGTSIFGKAARNYLIGRGFNIKRLALKGVGYCTRGEYAGYVIFPFFKQGKLIYFQGRIYMGSGPKMKNPPEELYGVGKSSLIYNQDALFMYDRAYWVESITNAETLGDAASAGLGKTVSPYQLSNLLFSPCSKLILLLDDDAYEQSIKLAMQIVHYKRIKVIKMPIGEDVNKIGKKRTLALIKKTPYHNYGDLLKLKNSLNERCLNTYSRVGPNKTDRRGS